MLRSNDIVKPKTTDSMNTYLNTEVKQGLKDLYEAYETKRICEKLNSDICYWDIYNLKSQIKQFDLYDSERKKIINQVSGCYASVKRYDEVFKVGDIIDIYYMDVKKAVINQIKVEESFLTWRPEYIITANNIDTGEVYEIDERICIHHHVGEEIKYKIRFENNAKETQQYLNENKHIKLIYNSKTFIFCLASWFELMTDNKMYFRSKHSLKDIFNLDNDKLIDVIIQYNKQLETLELPF